MPALVVPPGPRLIRAKCQISFRFLKSPDIFPWNLVQEAPCTLSQVLIFQTPAQTSFVVLIFNLLVQTVQAQHHPGSPVLQKSAVVIRDRSARPRVLLKMRVASMDVDAESTRCARVLSGEGGGVAG